MLDKGYRKIPLLPRDAFYLCQGEQLDIDMPADLDQFRGEDSHGAIIRRKGLIQLGHNPSDAW
jgi:hypothetical protein